MKAVTLCLAGVMALATTAAAQESSLQGRVVRWGTNEPVGKVSVELRPIASAAAAPFVATTGGDGTFVFPSVPAGQYRVVASRAGYVNAEYGQRWPKGAGTPLTLSAGQTVNNVPIPMLQTGAINGVVRDALGASLASVEVQALQASYQTGRRFMNVVQSVVTDDRGEYRLFWLTPGKYFVVARHPDLGSSPILVGGVMIGGAGPPGGRPRYQLFKTSGDNAASTPVYLNTEKPPRQRYMPVYYPNTTDEFAAAAIDVASAGEVQTIDFTVAPIPLQHLRGRVVYESNNEPAMSALVQWITPSGMSAADGDTFLGPQRGATQVQCCDGTFEIGLPQGTYTLVAAVDNLTARVPITVGDSDIDGVVLAIGRRFNIKGTVKFEGGAPSPAELRALRLSLPTDPPVSGLLVGGFSNVLPDGTFTLAAARGDFMLSVQPLLLAPGVFQGPAPPPPIADVYIKSALLGGIDVLNNGVHLDGDPQQTLEIVISRATGAFEGRVVGGDRQPVPNIAVVLMPEGARRNRVDLVKSVSADASGRFRFERVPPGDYRAFAFDGMADGEWLNPEFRSSHDSIGTTVTISAGTSAAVELTPATN